MRQDNPHISKRRGGRKVAHRRFSLQVCCVTKAVVKFYKHECIERGIENNFVTTKYTQPSLCPACINLSNLLRRFSFFETRINLIYFRSFNNFLLHNIFVFISLISIGFLYHFECQNYFFHWEVVMSSLGAYGWLHWMSLHGQLKHAKAYD